MKKIIVLFSLILLSNYTFANDDLYQEMLAKHASSGHIAKQEVENQELENLRAKSSHNNLGNAVRGVASSISHKPESLKLINPPIEISTK